MIPTFIFAKTVSLNIGKTDGQIFILGKSRTNIDESLNVRLNLNWQAADFKKKIKFRLERQPI